MYICYTVSKVKVHLHVHVHFKKFVLGVSFNYYIQKDHKKTVLWDIFHHVPIMHKKMTRNLQCQR